MKLKLHSQSQSRDLICKHLRQKLRLVTFLPFPLRISLRSWLISPYWMCAQYFPMVINPPSCRTELSRTLLISPTDTAVALRPKSFFHSWFISLYLSVPPPLSVSVSVFLFKSFTLHLFPGLFSLAQIYLQHATFGHASPGFEVCLLRVFVCRTPKLPLWNATFGIWRMRFKC